MSPIEFFQYYWNYRTTDPPLFYGIATGVLLLFIMAIRSFRRRKKNSKIDGDEFALYSEVEKPSTQAHVTLPIPDETTEKLDRTMEADAGPSETVPAAKQVDSDAASPNVIEAMTNTSTNNRTPKAIELSLSPEEEAILMSLWDDKPTPTAPAEEEKSTKKVPEKTINTSTSTHIQEIIEHSPSPEELEDLMELIGEESPNPTVPAEEEKPSKIKNIGYTPINVFAQSEPMNFPYVLMPASNSVIKFPRKGRTNRKGYKEESFKAYIEKFFKNEFQIFDDRNLPLPGGKVCYEPDITLVNENADINIFLDIEIDEPYEGNNDIANRKTTHYQHVDANRNHAFVDRGWIVVRFAEIQIHQDPEACCRYIADVIKSIDSTYAIPSGLTHCKKVPPIRQWSQIQAQNWSKERHRERYLGISSFGITSEGLTGHSDHHETAIEQEIEDLVIETSHLQPPLVNIPRQSDPKVNIVERAIRENKYLSLRFRDSQTIIRPITSNGIQLVGFCYVKNMERNFPLSDLTDLSIKEKYHSLRITGPSVGVDKIKNAVNIAIMYHRYIRMKYTRSAWNGYAVDPDTGEVYLDVVESEESIRTISDVQLAIVALGDQQILRYNLDENYIRAYCHRREAERTFKFDRIGEIEILDI